MSDRPRQFAWLFDFVTMVAVILGLTFGAIELRELRAAQEAQAVLELFQTIQTPEYVRGGNLIIQLPDDLTPDELREVLDSEDGALMSQIAMTFEGLGVMVYRGDVNIEWVDEMFRFMILTSWDKFEPLTLRDRADLGYANYMEWHQWLAERLEQRSDGAEPVPAYEAYSDWVPPR